jgi:antitoxin ParD1/3/4
MPSLRITLSAEQMAFVDACVKAGTNGSRSQYIASLIQLEQFKTNRDTIDTLLLEAIATGPATPMTGQDWRDIEREGLQRLAEENRNAKRPKKQRRSKRSA